jgi:hypothetical protein
MPNEMFKPNLLLWPEEGKYRLFSIILTPNACYSADRVERGWPKGEIAIPEAMGVMLHLRYKEEGVCAQVLTPVLHIEHGLELYEGRDSVIAYAMLDGKNVGVSRITIRSFGALEKLLAEGGGEVPVPYSVCTLA